MPKNNLKPKISISTSKSHTSATSDTVAPAYSDTLKGAKWGQMVKAKSKGILKYITINSSSEFWQQRVPQNRPYILEGRIGPTY